MKTKIALLTLLTSSLISFSQNLKEKDIYGKWRSEKIIEKPADSLIDIFAKGMNNSIFIFHENKDFELITSSKLELFLQAVEFTKGSKWIIGSSHHNKIRVDIERESEPIMDIKIQKIDNEIIFEFKNQGVKIQMQKIKNSF